MDNADAYIFQMAANLLRDRGRRERVRANYRASVRANAVDLEPLDPARVLLGRESLGEALRRPARTARPHPRHLSSVPSGRHEAIRTRRPVRRLRQRRCRSTSSRPMTHLTRRVRAGE